MEYCIVKSKDLDKLVVEVNAKMALGWIMQGGVDFSLHPNQQSFSSKGHGLSQYFVQALIRYANSDSEHCRLSFGVADEDLGNNNRQLLFGSSNAASDGEGGRVGNSNEGADHKEGADNEDKSDHVSEDDQENKPKRQSFKDLLRSKIFGIGRDIQDISSLNLGVRVKGNKFSVIIPAQTIIGQAGKQASKKFKKTYTTSTDNQTKIEIKILQGSSEIADENDELATIDINDISPMPAGEPDIEVEFSLDATGMLVVEATQGGDKKRVEIKESGGIKETK